tara:strand:- start:711 stop:998 length:288 start_codon:yes stop_codon:yes gene_type:complete
MAKISKIGMSTRFTNDTGVLGNMAGLPPTATARSSIVGHKGLSYKYDAIQNNNLNFSKGCGFGQKPANQKACIKSLNLLGTSVSNGFRAGKKMLA